MCQNIRPLLPFNALWATHISHILHSFPPHIPLIHILLNQRLQRARVGTHERISQLAILEDNKGWHGAHGEFLRYVGDGVDVDFVEACFFIDVGESGVEGLAGCL